MTARSFRLVFGLVLKLFALVTDYSRVVSLACPTRMALSPFMKARTPQVSTWNLVSWEPTPCRPWQADVFLLHQPLLENAFQFLLVRGPVVLWRAQTSEPEARIQELPSESLKLVQSFCRFQAPNEVWASSNPREASAQFAPHETFKCSPCVWVSAFRKALSSARPRARTSSHLLPLPPHLPLPEKTFPANGRVHKSWQNQCL